MRIIKNLATHKFAVVLIVCLLAVQAICELSLPKFTSDIVDVGIQQSGVEHASCEMLTGRTHDLIAVMIDDDKEDLFARSYALQDDGTYSLTNEGYESRDELDSAIAEPLVVVRYAGQIGVDLDSVKTAYDAGMITKEEIKSSIDHAKEQMGTMADSLIDQQAIAAATQEYKELGFDLDGLQMRYLLSTGGKMLALSAFGVLIAIAVSFISSRTAAKIGARLRSGLFERVLSFSDAEIQSFSAASLITRGTNDVQLVQMVTVMLLRMVLYAPILAIGGIIMISQTNLSMGWIIIVAVVVIGFVMLLLMKVAMPKFKIMQRLIDKVNLVSREILTGLPVIRAFGRESFEEERFDQANTNLMKTQLFTNRVMTFMMPVMMLIMNLVSVAIVWFGGLAIDAGTLQTGDLIAFITYSMVIIMGFLMIGMLSIMLPRADVAAKRIDEVLTTQSSIVDPKDCGQQEVALLSNNQGAEISFDKVSFRYNDSSDYVLEDISFTAQSGKVTAIIGSTGSGKTTILKLIERFADVTEGSITIDGIDIRTVSLKALRSQLGYVPQKAFLFSGTVESNVAYAEDSCGLPKVENALSIAQATFVSDMDKGIESEISQGGTNVSGGQRQRLAIARALASNARAYLFDDSFSALDYKTDAALRHELQTKLSGKTQIIVAQRISTVLNADQIIVLDEGRIAGKGTHKELMETCQPYQEIALSQLSEEELKGGGN